MLDFQQKKTLRRVLYHPITVGIIVIIAMYSVYSTWSVYEKMAKSRANVDRAQAELFALEQKNTTLDSEISQLQTTEGVEREIREKYGVVKPDENMAVIVESSDSSDAATTTSVSWWSKFLHFLGL